MPSARPTVRVQPDRRGRWEVMVPERRERVACETLDDATRVAYEYAGRRSPCELVVRDAYYRVLRSEIIGGKQPRSRLR